MSKTEIYKHHIEIICLKNDITIIYKSNYNGRAWKKERIIKIPFIKSIKSYVLALHEIGHILNNKNEYKLLKEVLAWKYAINNAIELNKSAYDKMYKCLNAYIKWGYRRKGVKLLPCMEIINNDIKS